MEDKKTLDDLITKEGLLVNGMGILPGKFDKMIALLVSIEKKLFFMEKRQQEWFEKEHPEAKKSY